MLLSLLVHGSDHLRELVVLGLEPLELGLELHVVGLELRVLFLQQFDRRWRGGRIGVARGCVLQVG